jgi:diguanylate cyclase (GGDEF)-like protein
MVDEVELTVRDLPKVLIVDDDKTSLLYLCKVLDGYTQVLQAQSGQQAIDKALSLKPDLILLDINMPEMSGFEIIKILKNDPATVSIPVVFVTACTAAIDEEKGFLLGAVDYIRKPYQPIVVKARVRNQLQLIENRKILEKAAWIDALTAIPNRRQYDKTLEVEWASGCRLKEAMALIMIDIDNFKRYNDVYGHPEGDRVLIKVANALKVCVKRPRDLVARYGGEEFVIILPLTTRDGGMKIADDCRRAIQELAIVHPETQAGVVTISCGGVNILPTADQTALDVVALADKQLYRSKSEGRNRVSWHN